MVLGESMHNCPSCWQHFISDLISRRVNDDPNTSIFINSALKKYNAIFIDGYIDCKCIPVVKIVAKVEFNANTDLTFFMLAWT